MEGITAAAASAGIRALVDKPIVPAKSPAMSFPVWPMVAVGVVAVGLFVATLAIKSKR